MTRSARFALSGFFFTFGALMVSLFISTPVEDAILKTELVLLGVVVVGVGPWVFFMENRRAFAAISYLLSAIGWGGVVYLFLAGGSEYAGPGIIPVLLLLIFSGMFIIGLHLSREGIRVRVSLERGSRRRAR